MNDQHITGPELRELHDPQISGLHHRCSRHSHVTTHPPTTHGNAGLHLWYYPLCSTLIKSNTQCWKKRASSSVNDASALTWYKFLPVTLLQMRTAHGSTDPNQTQAVLHSTYLAQGLPKFSYLSQGLLCVLEDTLSRDCPQTSLFLTSQFEITTFIQCCEPGKITGSH